MLDAQYSYLVAIRYGDHLAGVQQGKVPAILRERHLGNRGVPQDQLAPDLYCVFFAVDQPHDYVTVVLFQHFFVCADRNGPIGVVRSDLLICIIW